MGAIGLAFVLAEGARPLPAQDPSRPCSVELPTGGRVPGGPVYRDCDVERVAQLRRDGHLSFTPRPSTAPRGEWHCEKAELTFVVDSTGVIELSTVRLRATTSPEFAAAVIGSLPTATYTPARLSGKPVRQVVPYERSVLIRKVVITSGSRLTGRRLPRC